MNVLFISAWYPHRYDAMFGLFVQKHARAVNLYCNVKVLYVHPDDKISDFEITNTINNNLQEIIVYYPINKSGFFNKLIKSINYVRAYIKGFKVITSEGFKPQLIHANILTRIGVIACFYKLFTNIPYVVTEHWSRYLNTRNEFSGFFRVVATKCAVRNASAIMPVSLNLQHSMEKYGLHNPNYQIVNNVVDDFFFENIKIEKRNKKRIVNITCFDNQAKNISGLLRATRELSKVRTDFELILIGTGVDFDSIYNYHQELGFPENTVQFVGEQSPIEVAHWLYNCDFFLMFSNYENSPVVICESLACGKPVLSTNVGGIAELVNDENGILIPVKDEIALLNKMNYLLDNFDQYDAEKIRLNAKDRFSFESIGKKITDIYTQIV